MEGENTNDDRQMTLTHIEQQPGNSREPEPQCGSDPPPPSEASFLVVESEKLCIARNLFLTELL